MKYRRRAKKTYVRRKKTYRRKRNYNRKRTTYDGTYYAKIHAVKYLRYGSLAACGFHTVGWGQSGTSDNFSTFLSS